MKLNNKSISKVLKYIAAIIVITGIVLFVSMSQFFFPKEEKILAPPLRKPEEVVYNTYEVKKTSIVNKITCRGHFVPENQVDVSFKNRDGYLKAMYVTAGQMVRKGYILATLDIDTLLNEIKRQALTLKRAEEIRNKLKDISEIDISISRMKLEELKNELEVKYQLKESMAQIDIEKFEHEVAIQEQTFHKSVLEYQYQVSAAEREIEMAQLKLSELELELEKSTIKAPVSGTVTSVAYLNEGEYSPSYKIITSIADPHRLILMYSGSEYDHFRLGMEVDVDINGTLYNGKIIMTPLQVPHDEYEQMKETIQIRIDSLPPDLEIDDHAIITATLEKAENVIVIPKRLVNKYVSRIFVKVLENGLVNERDVEIGIESPSEYEITSGLKEGDLVVD